MALLAEQSVAPAAPDRLVRRVELLLVGGFAAFAAWFIWRSAAVVDGRRTFTLFDDAMISMRYGRNLASGDGLVYNANEHVEGYSNLLWTIVMAGVHAVVSDVRLTSAVVAVIGLTILLAQLELVRRLVRSATDARWAPALAIAVTGANFALSYWTLRGMEVGLVGLFLLAAIAVDPLLPDWTERRRSVAIAALLVAAVLTRDDALVAAGAILLVRALHREPADRVPAVFRAGAGLAGLVLLRVGLRWWMYGELVPNTYELKVGGVSRTLLLERGAASIGLLLTFGVAVPVACAALSWRSSALARTCVVVVAAQAAYSVAVGGDAWEYFGFANRFVATVTAPLAVAAVLGVVALRRGETVPAARVTAVVGVCAVAVAIVLAPRASPFFGVGDGGSGADAVRVGVLLVAAAALLTTRRHLGAAGLAVTLVLAGNAVPAWNWFTDPTELTGNDPRWAEYGSALRDATSEQTVIAAAAIGNLGYFADRPIVDLLGKIDPQIARTAPRLEQWLIPGHSKWDSRWSIGERRPDVVAQLFAPEADDLELLRSLGYEPIGPYLYVQRDSDRVDVDALERAAALAH